MALSTVGWTLVLLTSVGGQPAMTSIEYDNKTACETVGQQFVKDRQGQAEFYCYPKMAGAPTWEKQK